MDNNLVLDNDKDLIQKIDIDNNLNDIIEKVSIDNLDSIIYFGQESTKGITEIADSILKVMEKNDVQGSSNMLSELNKIMNKFDIVDFKDKEPSFLEKMFNKTKNNINELLKKYEIMGSEIDKVYIELKKYEAEINSTNTVLDNLYLNNMSNYKEIERYISAGKIIIDKFKNQELGKLKNIADETNEDIDRLKQKNMEDAILLLEQKVFDLELAKNVLIQSLPQIKMIQQGNYNLIRKINSAFVVTLPIFKQGLIQAIAIKRQGIQIKAMQTLDEKTNELLLKNADNLSIQSKLATELAGSSFVNIETLEKTWNTIIKSIDETKTMEEELRQKRIDGESRLKLLQSEYSEKLNNKL